MDPDFILVGRGFGDSTAPTERLLEEEPMLQSLRALREDRVIAMHPRLISTGSQEMLTAA